MTNTPIDFHPHRVLIVDDDPSCLALASHILNKAGYQVLTAENGRKALEVLFNEGSSLVVTDWNMPDISGEELCRTIRGHEAMPFVYVIMVTAHSDANRIVNAFEAGADDYLAKPYNPRELLARLRAGERVVNLQMNLDRHCRDMHRFNAELALAHEKLGEANKKLHLMAVVDELTGLTNRREALARLDEFWSISTREGSPIACVMLDIDHFKSVNDSHGHAMGDCVLKNTAEVLRSSARMGELVARIGGEEFLVICPNATADQVEPAAERFRCAVERHESHGEGHTLRVTVSLGVAERAPEMRCPAGMLKMADDALYDAKRAGRNCVRRAARFELQPALT